MRCRRSDSAAWTRAATRSRRSRSSAWSCSRRSRATPRRQRPSSRAKFRAMSRLGPEQLERYKRHLLLDGIGPEGQKKLLRSSALLIGAGGLGSPAALYLAAAGVGRLGLVDFDVVDLTNLQRQILHGTKDVGRSKLESARDRLRDINPEIELKLHECRFSSANAQQIVADYDVVVDGSDNFATRY